jgi:hypothetical protein
MCTSWKRNNCDELSGATERWQHTAGTYQLLQGAWEEDMYENGQGMEAEVTYPFRHNGVYFCDKHHMPFGGEGSSETGGGGGIPLRGVCALGPS